jgi:cytochrome b6-f complex iron-sulfur subunit
MASAFAMLFTWGTAKFVFFKAATKKKREISDAVTAKLQPGIPVHVPEAEAWLLRVAGSDDVVALDDRCTHLGCRARWNSDRGVFACPCHGSEFSPDGKVIRGPATRSLQQFDLVKEAEGKIRLRQRQSAGSKAT